MTEITYLRDPTNEAMASMRKSIPMPDDIAGKTIALLDISKERSMEFLDHIEAQFSDDGFTVKRFRKATMSKPAATRNHSGDYSRSGSGRRKLAD